MMRAGALCLSLSSGPAAADIVCQMQQADCTAGCVTAQVRFFVDPSQFVLPQAPGDPPRRQRTTVTMGDIRFDADAILMQGGIRGFHEDAPNHSRLMIVQPDGAARLVEHPANRNFVGTCQ